MKLLGDQRFNLEDLLLQRSFVRAAQVGMTDLATDLERFAIVVQMAIGDGQDFFGVRHLTDEVQHRALTDLVADSRRTGRWDALVVVKPLHLVGGVGSPPNATALR